MSTTRFSPLSRLCCSPPFSVPPLCLSILDQGIRKNLSFPFFLSYSFLCSAARHGWVCLGTEAEALVNNTFTLERERERETWAITGGCYGRTEESGCCVRWGDRFLARSRWSGPASDAPGNTFLHLQNVILSVGILLLHWIGFPLVPPSHLCLTDSEKLQNRSKEVFCPPGALILH